MDLTLQTDRLILRPLEMADEGFQVALSTDPEVMRYVGPLETPEEVAMNMPKYVRRCAEGAIGIWCILDRTTGEKLGGTALLPLPIALDDTDWDLVQGGSLPDAEIEIGALLKRSAWGRGYATETCQRLLRFAFEETAIEDIVGIIDPKNTASGNMLKKSGLIYEGLRRAYGGAYPGYRITRQQWLTDNR